MAMVLSVMEPGDVLVPVSLDPSPTIDAYKVHVDRTLLRENLRLTTSQRVEKMIAAMHFADAVRNSRTIPGQA